MKKQKKATIDKRAKQLTKKGNEKGAEVANNNSSDNDPSGNQGGGVGFGGMDGGYSDFDGYDAEGDNDSGGFRKSGKPERNTIKKSKRARDRK